jgi:peptidoglycan/xylan/chitin deacetylase (PgdA/CDA1 family)
MPPPLALCHHGVADVGLGEDVHRLFVRPRDLREEIERLRAWGYELLTFSAWACRVMDGAGAGCATLTFDDGFADNLHALAPLLAELRAPATVFVVSGWLGRTHPAAPGTRILSVSELRELYGLGVEIGAHSRTHADLRTVSAQEARVELAGSRADLEDLLGSEISVAAYPYGRSSPAVEAAARDSGLASACALWTGRWSSALDLPRQAMENRSTAFGLRLKQRERYAPLMQHRSARLLRRLRLAALGAPLRPARVVTPAPEP